MKHLNLLLLFTVISFCGISQDKIRIVKPKADSLVLDTLQSFNSIYYQALDQYTKYYNCKLKSKCTIYIMAEKTGFPDIPSRMNNTKIQFITDEFLESSIKQEFNFDFICFNSSSLDSLRKKVIIEKHSLKNTRFLGLIKRHKLTYNKDCNFLTQFIYNSNYHRFILSRAHKPC